MRYTEVVHEALVEQRVCNDKRACVQGEFAKWEGGRAAVLFWPATGPFVNLYGIPSAQVVDAVAGRIREIQQAEALPPVTLTAYAGPHSSKGASVRTVRIEPR
ncbi:MULTISPECIES: hypothetical protein [unclassified Hydrogenophaga]|uniref:hypothetical protein n=1 Tax=unclassified Hydrogenophaga TaxID=2610897 RepID=UPI0012E3390C|nr:hypothetical protein [Hydrogenophaga sp. Root209]